MNNSHIRHRAYITNSATYKRKWARYC